jgi:hypothetical protein
MKSRGRRGKTCTKPKLEILSKELYSRCDPKGSPRRDRGRTAQEGGDRQIFHAGLVRIGQKQEQESVARRGIAGP